MDFNVKLTGRGMSSRWNLIVCSLFCLVVLSCRSKAQIQGQVTVIDSTGDEWRFLCTAHADPATGNMFYFDLPALYPNHTNDPDFSESAFCEDGCDWAWDYEDATIEGLTVWLPSSASGTGSVTTVTGWPIIDNIDVRAVEPSNTQPRGAVTQMEIAVGNGVATVMVCKNAHDSVHLTIADLRGTMMYSAKMNASEQEIQIALASGVYVFSLEVNGKPLSRRILIP